MKNDEIKSFNVKTKSFACETCAKNYKTISSLNQHKLVHSGERPYNCNICDKSFGRKYVLKQHMFVHSGKKDF